MVLFFFISRSSITITIDRITIYGRVYGVRTTFHIRSLSIITKKEKYGKITLAYNLGQIRIQFLILMFFMYMVFLI